MLVGTAQFVAPSAAKGPPFGVPPGQAKKAQVDVAAGPSLPIPPGHANHTPPGQAKRAAMTGASSSLPGGIAARPLQPASPAPAPSGGSPQAAVPLAQSSPPAQPLRAGHPRQRHTGRPVPRRPRARASAVLASAAPAAHRPVEGARQAGRARAIAPVAPRPARRALRTPVRPVSAPVKHTPAPPTLVTVERTLTRTVREIARVTPLWTKLALASLAALLALAAAIAGATGVRNRRLRRQRASLLGDVGALQEALLPAVPSRISDLEVSVSYRPAGGELAGGDFYDVFALDRDRVGIIIGDVAGHGEDALTPATFVRHLVRSYMEAGMTPRAAIQLAGNVLDEQDDERFATVLAAIYDASARTLSYARAGHPPPIVTGPAEHEPLITASSPPAGVGEITGTRQTTITLPANSTVCFYTDGLTEARAADGFFGRERLAETVRGLSDDADADDLVDRVNSATESVPDDVVVCLIRTTGEGSAAAVRVEEIEVTMSELRTPRPRRFLEACGVAPRDADAAIAAAMPHVVGYASSALLRVRMAAHRSGVDVVPAGGVSESAPVLSLR